MVHDQDGYLPLLGVFPDRGHEARHLAVVVLAEPERANQLYQRVDDDQRGGSRVRGPHLIQHRERVLAACALHSRRHLAAPGDLDRVSGAGAESVRASVQHDFQLILEADV